MGELEVEFLQPRRRGGPPWYVHMDEAIGHSNPCDTYPRTQAFLPFDTIRCFFESWFRQHADKLGRDTVSPNGNVDGSDSNRPVLQIYKSPLSNHHAFIPDRCKADSPGAGGRNMCNSLAPKQAQGSRLWFKRLAQNLDSAGTATFEGLAVHDCKCRRGTLQGIDLI